MSRAALLAPMACAACAVGPDYRRPEVDSPARFAGDAASNTSTSAADLPWWDLFQDPALRELIEAGVRNNYDVRIAVARVEQNRALQMQARSQLFPQLTYELDAERGRNSFLGRAFPSMGGPLSTTNSFLGSIDAAWEIDLWGRIRRLSEAAEADLFASEEARRDVLITLIGDVAQAYFELLALDHELEISRRTAKSFAQSLRIFRDRFEGGVASKLETSRAEASLAATEATIPDLERQIALKSYQLCVLLGRNPGAIDRDTTLLAARLPPDIPVGLPSALLQRRPDVRRAEEQVRAANARIGAAIADFFPKIGLTGILGAVSTALSKLLSGDSLLWSFGAGITGPIFKGGQVLGDLDQARAVFEEAVIRYRATALTAFSEVSSALTSRAKLIDIVAGRQRAVEAGRVAVEVATDRYRQGNASYYEVLEAEQQLFTDDNALAVARRDQLVVVVQLYKALGGGWGTKLD